MPLRRSGQLPQHLFFVLLLLPHTAVEEQSQSVGLSSRDHGLAPPGLLAVMPEPAYAHGGGRDRTVTGLIRAIVQSGSMQTDP